MDEQDKDNKVLEETRKRALRRLSELDKEIKEGIGKIHEEIVEDMPKRIELNDFYLPITIQNDCDYEVYLDKKLNDYLEAIRDRELVDEEVYNRTKLNVEGIKKALSFYYDADISNAKKVISNILENYCCDNFIVSSLDNSPAIRGITKIVSKPNPIQYKLANAPLSFFRARVGSVGYDKKDFLHIPFNKRGYVSTQRFSIAGVPCMYFGLTSYVCWLELDKPLYRDFNAASYEINSDVKVLNLAISQMLLNGLSNFNINGQNVGSLIAFFPLVIATSYKVNEKDRSFRSEYIISQLVMQCLSEFGIDGVAYISKRVEKDSNSFPFGVNLAIPMKNDSEFYSEFAKKIPLTKPVNYEEYKKEQPKPKTDTAAYANLWDKKYTQHTFSQFDNYLFNEEHKTISSN
ncbi:hypothetical protein PVA17_21530 [Lysinibacillus sp. CNPSo 3705]|uniref:hypothetical protein n=1 Tax=Lysinibacillus sp. CNPSo 3705 TaxID=3028148 RepID=UPI00236422B3|nr:hypothetical protein [Lysinibacillus sp. CNPSo 3705]MDD1505305.1 hypothetical protein [Lysinibacillus sp. CNPSo 3705]